MPTLVPLLLQRAFESERLVLISTGDGWMLAVRYFGIQFGLVKITKEEFEELTKPNLAPVS